MPTNPEIDETPGDAVQVVNLIVDALPEIEDEEDEELEWFDPVWNLERVKDCPRLDFRCILWDLDYWSGPISGICKFNDEPCYFSRDQMHGYPDHRLYFVYKLTPEEFEAERTEFELWEKCVTGWQRRTNGKLVPDRNDWPDNFKLFNSLRGPKLNRKVYLTRDPVAWFDDRPTDVNQ